jgi:c-di-AMP phosphodiesterase-like protein
MKKWYEKEMVVTIFNFIIVGLVILSVVFIKDKFLSTATVVFLGVIANIYNIFVYGNKMIDKAVSYLSQYYDDRMKNELDAIIKKIKNDMEA